MNYFNTFNDSSINSNFGTIHFNPIDKWLEVIDENKKLYERLLASEREKVELLKGKHFACAFVLRYNKSL